jgi:hypothetical protein
MTENPYSTRPIHSIDVDLRAQRGLGDAPIVAKVKVGLADSAGNANGPSATIEVSFAGDHTLPFEALEQQALDRALAVLDRIRAEPAESLSNRVGRWGPDEEG